VERPERRRMTDPIHRGRCTPPTESVAHTSAGLKGKSAVRIHREPLHKQQIIELLFWATGYAVSTVGLEEAHRRQSIRVREKLESGQGEGDRKQGITWAPAGPFRPPRHHHLHP